jgi:hypothetical protein
MKNADYSPEGGEMKSPHSLKAIVLTDKPEHARKGLHLADLVDAYQTRPFPPGVYNVLVRHDTWCSLLKNRGPCNCNPDVEIQ